MKRILLGLCVPAFACVLICSCLNINSFNKVRPDYESGCCSMKTELYFGLLKPDGTTISEAEWQAFVDKSICPLFPNGFTLVDAFGQCKNESGKIIREKTKMLIVVQGHEDDDANIGKIKDEFSKAFPKNAFFKVSYKVSSSLDAGCCCDGDDDGESDQDED